MKLPHRLRTAWALAVSIVLVTVGFFLLRTDRKSSVQGSNGLTVVGSKEAIDLKVREMPEGFVKHQFERASERCRRFYETAGQRDSYSEGYKRGFIAGFLHPYAKSFFTSPNSPHLQGCEDGRLDGIAAAGRHAPFSLVAPYLGFKFTEAKGTAFFALEQSEFHSCDCTKPWWLEGNVEFYQRYNEVEKSLSAEQRTEHDVKKRQIFLWVKGYLNAEGAFGHFGAYPNEFIVTDVIELRVIKPGDCK